MVQFTSYTFYSVIVSNFFTLWPDMLELHAILCQVHRIAPKLKFSGAFS